MKSYSLKYNIMLAAILAVAMVLTFGCAEVFGIPADAGFFGDIDSDINLYVNYDDYSELLQDNAYLEKVEVTGIQAIKQKVSSGLACIEMLGKWQGKQIDEYSLVAWRDIETEAELLKEMLIQFPEWETTLFAAIPDVVLLKKIHASLKNGFPVPVQTILDGSLHFSIVTSMDLGSDKIIAQDPLGYEQEYAVDDFIYALKNNYEKHLDKKHIYIITDK